MLEELARNAPQISESAKYWFIRTDGGKLYEAFRATNSIAIGYSLINIEFLKQLEDDGDGAREAVKQELKKHYPPQRGADGRVSDLSGLHASQLLRFCKEIKRGDVVVVPSEKTERLAIGFIDDDEPYGEILTHAEQRFTDFNKRRKVRWVRGVDRLTINPNLFKLFLNQQTVVDATPYSNWIDSLLYQFFRKGDKYHYILRVSAKDHIRAQGLFRSFIELFDLAKEFASSEGVAIDFEDVETRINLNSPGDVELWKEGVTAIGLLAVLVIAINGGGFSWKGKDTEIGLKTEGFMKRLNEFLNDRKRRQLVDDARTKLAALNVETPEQVIALLKEIKK